MTTSLNSFVDRQTRRAGLLLGCGLLGITFVSTDGPFAGAAAEQGQGRSQGNGPATVFTLTHGPVATLLVTAGSSGHQLGDLRVLPATPVMDASGAVVGRLDAQLLTTSIDYPTFGDEVRMSTLNFVFGLGTNNLSGSADQILVSGSGYYPSTNSTIPVGDSLVRPITGGSGSHAGATGWAETVHLLDGTWRHTFHLLPPPRR